MTPHDLLNAFETLADAPSGVERLRELVLQLAVRGKLVLQDPDDEPVDDSILDDGRARLFESAKVKKPQHPTGVDIETIPYEIPTKWRWLRLGDVAVIVGGGTPRSKEPTYWTEEDGIPWVTPADMKVADGKFVHRGRRDISQAGLANSSAQLLPAHSVLFSSRAPIGYVGINPAPIATNQGFKSCVPHVLGFSSYIFLYLKAVGPEISREATGTTFKEVSGREVSLVPIAIPPLNEQSRIVARVDELMGFLDQLEEAQYARNATRERLRDSALAELRDANSTEEVEVAWERVSQEMHDLFTKPEDVQPLRDTILQLAVRGRLVRQDPTDEPASELVERIAEEKQRLYDAGEIRKPKDLPPIDDDDVPYELPKGWEWVRIDDVCHVGGGLQKSGKRKPVKNIYPYLRVANVQRGALELDEIKYFELYDGELDRYRLEEGDLLVVEGNGSAAHIGRAARWDGSIPDCIHQNHLIRCRPYRAGIERYLLRYLNSPSGMNIMRELAVTTSGLYNLSVGKIRRIIVPMPPTSEQSHIVERVDELTRICDALESSLTAAQDLRNRFAESAVSGLEV